MRPPPFVVGVMSDRPVRIAAQLHPQHGTYEAMRTAVLRAEEMGFDIVYNWDHFFPLYGDRDGLHYECWTVLAAWAELTTTVEIGALVTCNSYRNPELLADMARTVDHVSGGRLILGIGSGWFRRDYLEYGYEFGTAGSRLDDLGAALPRIESRLARLNPPPLRDIPILVAGGGSRKTTRLVARHADSWHAGFPDHPDELDDAVTALLGWCEKEGRDPGDIEWGLGVEPDDLARFLREDASALHDKGFTQFTLGFQGPDWDVSRGADWLAWRDEVNDA
ncbi:MAG: LLM class F420-dependent oxidoreductase [Actinobacteria bacterium]|nr:LLM class F420-dependent oxidoreductase [Actinomycetota bacterium]